MSDKHPDKPAFLRKQYEFAAHLRNPDRHAKPPEVEERRMAIYRGLFYRNIEGFIAGGFPVLRRLYTDDQWHERVRGFFSRHRSRSPYFLEIAGEFLDFLRHEYQPGPEDPPFMLELAHYEWVELALSVSDKTADMSGIDPNADLLSGRPVLSPLAWVLSYRWPVHMLGPDFRPESPPEQPTHIVVFRDRNDRVRFVVINAVTARLLQLLDDDERLSGRGALERIAGEMQHPDPAVVLDGGRQALEQLKSQGIILGTRSRPAAD